MSRQVAIEAVEDRIAEVKAGLVAAWAPLPVGKTEDKDRVPIGLLEAVLDHEPKQAPALPLLTMQTRGFYRAGLEKPRVRDPIIDPLMGRAWVFRFDVRVWVGVHSDEKKAQEDLDVLIPQVVAALEYDRSLEGVAVDAALEEGDAAVVVPQTGNSLLMLTCSCFVETEEDLNPN